MGRPAHLRAQTTNKAPTEKKAPSDTKPVSTSEKKASAGPFHGKLAAVDQVAKTITVGKRTFQITSETKIKKGDKPATLEDGVVGEEVSGYIKPAADGKLVATKVTFGPKADTKAGDKKSTTDKADKADKPAK
jgi:hypothetical protein